MDAWYSDCDSWVAISNQKLYICNISIKNHFINNNILITTNFFYITQKNKIKGKGVGIEEKIKERV